MTTVVFSCRATSIAIIEKDTLLKMLPGNPVEIIAIYASKRECRSRCVPACLTKGERTQQAIYDKTFVFAVHNF